MSKTYSAGIVTAYGAAKRAGYQGTYEDFCRQQAGYAGNAAAVEAAKTAAQTAANTATAKAEEAATAATAAQTAKTQTEAAASQALTDISTARSGAISAVQTEGQTQTANARAQAQAAAQSATTASTKASEASASATNAGQSATNAAASATSAANAASTAQGVLESIPSDYSQMSADVDQLKANLDDNVNDLKSAINNIGNDLESLDEFCRKEIVTETTGSFPVTSGTEISSNTHLVNVSIESNEVFKFKLNANGNLTSYHLYANNSALKYNCVAGVEYTLIKSSAITWLSIYVAGTGVTGTGVIEGVVKQMFATTDSLEEIIENVKNVGENTKEALESIIDANTVFLDGEYEIGASVNNNGNATYIYHDILFDVDGTKMVGILCNDIVNATSEFPIVVFEKDSSNTTLKRHNISKTVATRKDGVKIQPVANTTKIIVELYPSTTGGLTTQTAKYKNINIFTSNDGKFSIRNRNVPNPYPVPNYYLNAASNSYLQNKVSTIEGLIKDAEGNCDTFIFCTDQHWTLNAKQSPNLMNYICQRLVIPRMFMGGDYADGLNLNALKAYRDAFPGKIYDVIGNHEYMNYLAEIGESSVVHTIVDGDIWAYINLHMTDAVSGNFARNYYFVDNPMQKMRYIVLNVYADNGNSAIAAFEEEQELWFTNTALDLPNGYTAVIFAHRILGVNYETGETVFRPEGARIAEIADAYTGSGEIACLIAGHTHVDGMTTTEGGIPVFVTTCDKYLPWVDGGVNQEPWLTENRHLGTITEQAFDVIVLDKKHKLISFVRIGAPADNGEEEKLQIRQQYYGA